MTTDAERLGRQIEEARNARGWTQEDLHAAFIDAYGTKGAAVRTIQDWEAGVRSPKGKTLTRLRVLLGLPGDEGSAVAAWPERVQRVTNVLGDQLAGPSHDELRAWRHSFITRLLQESTERRHDWPDDVTVIAEIIGSYLTADMAE